MQAALDLGADIINDIWALRWNGDADGNTGRQVVSMHPSCGICLMHMHREPQTMQLATMEGDVIAQIKDFLVVLAQQLETLGVEGSRICLDPGIGFGKTMQQNFALLARQSELLPLGYPVLAGWSRKSSLAAVTQTSLAALASMNMQERMVPSVVAALLAVQNGASIVRVHDVRETVQALKVLSATQAAGKHMV
jgi:dihydropteroate synthase